MTRLDNGRDSGTVGRYRGRRRVGRGDEACDSSEKSVAFKIPNNSFGYDFELSAKKCFVMAFLH